MQVNVLEAKNQLSQLIKFAQAGDVVIIANRGTPVAQLVPAKAQSPVALPSTKGNFIKWLDENPIPAFSQRSAQEIDEAIAQERSAWD